MRVAVCLQLGAADVASPVAPGNINMSDQRPSSYTNVFYMLCNATAVVVSHACQRYCPGPVLTVFVVVVAVVVVVVVVVFVIFIIFFATCRLSIAHYHCHPPQHVRQPR